MAVLSKPLAENVQLALDHSLAKSTQANYQSARRCFEKFCSTYGFKYSPNQSADEYALSAFAASHIRVRSGGTAANQIAGLKAWHEMNNLRWLGGTRLAYVLRGVANLAPDSSKRAIRPPVTSEMLHILQKDLDLEVSRDAAVFGVATTAFWGQCRLGELLSTSRRNISNPALPSITSIGKRSSTNGSRELHLPRTKTNQRNGQTIILTRQDYDVDPLYAITRLIRLNNFPPSRSNIFIFRCPKSGTLRALTKEEFLARCNEIWSAHGYPRFTGHSFRAGGTSELLDKGVPPDIVKEMGRWRSDAFHRYWRGLGSIVARHAEYVHTKGHQPDLSRPGNHQSARHLRLKR